MATNKAYNYIVAILYFIQRGVYFLDVKLANLIEYFEPDPFPNDTPYDGALSGEKEFDSECFVEYQLSSELLENQSQAYAVTNRTGNYVYYTNDYRDAKEVMKDINDALAEHGIEGRAAILRRDQGTGEYKLHF